jgi:hypothetical protein
MSDRSREKLLISHDLVLFYYEFPSRLGLNKVSYCVKSLKLEYMFGLQVYVDEDVGGWGTFS